MLATAVGFKEVFRRYHQVDQAFQWVLSSEQWEKVENVNQVLSVFNEVTNMVLRSDYPTSNLFLLEVWKMKEILKLKCVDRHDNIRSMAGKMAQNFEKYWGECNLLMSIAAVLDPRYKMKLINFCFPLIYPDFEYPRHIQNVLAILHELFEVYVTAHNFAVLKHTVAEQAAVVSQSVSTPCVNRVSTARSMYQDHVRTTDVIWPLKSDLDIYLEEDVCVGDKNDSGEDIDNEFDALGWWKFNALK